MACSRDHTSNQIRCAYLQPTMDELESDLNVKLVNQDELESSITEKANKALISKEQELDEKRLRKTTAELRKTTSKIQALRRRLENPRTKLSQRRQLEDEISWFEENELQQLQQDMADIQARLRGNREELAKTAEKSAGEGRMAGESERDFLIRTGKITAFGNTSGFKTETGQSHVFLRAPGFGTERENRQEASMEKEVKTEDQRGRETPQDQTDENDQQIQPKLESSETQKSPEELEAYEYPQIDIPETTEAQLNPESLESYTEDIEVHSNDSEDKAQDSDADYKANIEAIDVDSESENEIPQKRRRAISELESEPESEAKSDSEVDAQTVEANIDDGNEDYYQKRLQEWVSRRSALRNENGKEEHNDKPEWFLPHPSVADAVLDSRFRLPGDIHPALFEYQKTCVQWLWELYCQKTGGILGDEMGLGKTIQVIAFLAGLHYSGLLDKPVLLVVPATVMNQWVNEFHRWWPPLRCVILHSIGSGMKNMARMEEELEEHLDEEGEGELSVRAANAQANASEMVQRVLQHGHVLVTTYVGLRVYAKHILPHEWGYAVLDEGHKIRNPNSAISLACKRIKTHNRVILSGTPIQNNLIELWSLFDFVFPGRLGTLPVFEQQFAIPINMGGYANASNLQVQTGYKCAVVLRDLISPYLLRRLKADVAQDLPKKSEMVLFVKLTQYQHDMYEKFLGSEDAAAIMKGRRRVLMGVDILRKICNHPDLVDRTALLHKKGYNYGSPARSGKMQVARQLLQLWQAQGHRTLLFCQTRQMLDILERFVARMSCIDAQGAETSNPMRYLRMDGSTPIGKRQQLVDTFNANEYYHVFLLTTKVGGLGVNLTGADRVIIFDPDWNPSTDIQARERAWRLGQKRDITIYRLMTAGTIEEKIYHRQIFKTFLTNKILKDPKQRRFFKSADLHDLFTLGDPDEKGTETAEMFNGSEKTFSGTKDRQSRRLEGGPKNDDDLYRVATLMGVSKLDKFAGDDDEKNGAKEDDRLMEGLFSGVHSALQHDEIVGQTHSEESLAEKEANRVAKEAAAALRKSRLAARKTAIGTPTWTGKFGVAGRFGPKKKANGPLKVPSSTNESSLSSTAILGELRQRRSVPEREPSNSRQELLERIVGVLMKDPDGFAKSGKILGALSKLVDLKQEKELVMVRSLLREVADWQKDEKGWKLKSELKDEGAGEE
ncbi:putative DNA repair and recombination protein [Clavispora lusitaniae]|uniref:DNA repair and recombination protein n=1 Tax=Clavispora lusitaniae TaxID=36911 RepID=A0ACD0WHJ6_CLALS|nr:putative DNA repair and recombination protein [Clavispora lusitaniae]QFZ32590.1 putative DNA repair and recombination protein [Clavispora lusitaniae]QFZ38259.1 putative DNA repair and recombination protein [Clavispora lusitaniae]QFZ43942.1 putative DNA repair and recombination protein [Clavispora lusitaniae]QFZ49619.1 putative DNA repair and recombination protein [Clavispora lusitaniae]